MWKSSGSSRVRCTLFSRPTRRNNALGTSASVRDWEFFCFILRFQRWKMRRCCFSQTLVPFVADRETATRQRVSLMLTCGWCYLTTHDKKELKEQDSNRKRPLLVTDWRPQDSVMGLGQKMALSLPQHHFGLNLTFETKQWICAVYIIVLYSWLHSATWGVTKRQYVHFFNWDFNVQSSSFNTVSI